MRYERPYLYPKQSEAFFNPSRYSLCEASTKSGKTVGAIAWILEQAFAGDHNKNYWWVAPIAPQADIAYRRIKSRLTPGSFTSRDSPTPTITLLNGARIWFKSADNPDSLFGEDVYAAVIDEASRCKEESWHALRSTLTATRGPVRIIGNVKGRKNWFYRLSRLAQERMDAGHTDMFYNKITVLDAISAGVIPADELEDAQRTLPEHVFKELYMAEPSDDTGNPFGADHILQCVGPLSDAPPAAFGIDLAKKQDFLVIVGLDDSGRTCVFQRWQGVPWRESIRRIHQIVGEDTPALVDSTGVGDPVLEELQHGHGNFSGFLFSQVGKQRLMEGLAVSIQGHEIRFPKGPIQTELESFEYELTRTGVKYSAPDGLHDDCVCALALARHKWAETQPGQSLMDFYQDQFQQASSGRLIGETEADETPWRRAKEVDSETVFDNELTELYLDTLSKYERQQLKCLHCGKAILGPSRITDGENYWHTECSLRGHQVLNYA